MALCQRRLPTLTSSRGASRADEPADEPPCVRSIELDLHNAGPLPLVEDDASSLLPCIGLDLLDTCAFFACSSFLGGTTTGVLVRLCSNAPASPAATAISSEHRRTHPERVVAPYETVYDSTAVHRQTQ
jgi:hypothetical protein